MNNLKLIINTTQKCCKQMSTNASINNFKILPEYQNRNPRNLERLRIGYKPDGYHIEKPGKCYWHKLSLTESSKYATASIIHFENGEVLRASTAEWALKKHLYRYNDVTAYINLGRVLADRCLKAGLYEINCFIEASNPEGRLSNFLNALKEGGVVLTEPPQFKAIRPWDQLRPEKPWEVVE